MSTTLHLPADLAARLAVEAAKRGMDVDALSTELLSASLAHDDDLEAFIGVGHSGRGNLGRRHREIKAEIAGKRSARDL